MPKIRLGLRRLWAKRRVRRLIKLIAVAALVWLIIAGLRHYFNSPVYGTLNNTPSGSSPAITDEQDYTPLNTSYYSLLYPNQYLPRIDHPAQSDLLEYKSYSDNESVLEIYVRRAPKDGIIFDADYKDYSSKQNIYKLSNKNIQGETVDFAEKGGNSKDKIALWLHGQYVLVVKITSAPKSQDLEKQFKVMLNSVQWHKN